MNQSRVCIQKSIEAAKKECVKKTNLLVYERDECKERGRLQRRKNYVPKITCPQAKQIRVCTGRELKKMCPPPKCDCDMYTVKRTRGEGAGLIITGFKSLLALGIVYATIQAGIWGDSCETHALYTKLCEIFLPDRSHKKKADAKYSPVACEEESEFFQVYDTNPCEDPFLDHEKGSHWLKEKYNKVVYTMFSAVAGFPYNIICLFKSGSEEKVLIAGDESTGEDECDMEDEDNYGGSREAEEK